MHASSSHPHLSPMSSVYFVTYVFYQVFIGIEVDLAIFKRLNNLDYFFILRRNQLAAILPIYFIAIVFRWIVRSCKYYTGMALKMPYGER